MSYKELFAKDNEEMLERFNLSRERISLIKNEESVAVIYRDYFASVSRFIGEICDFYDDELKRSRQTSLTFAELKELNDSLYIDVLNENYMRSYANPNYATEKLGKDIGGLLCFLYTEIQTLGIVLDAPSQYQRQHEYEGQFLQDNEEHLPEAQTRATLQQGEHSGNHQGRGKGRDDHIGRHGVDIATNLGGDHRGCSSCRTYDTREHTLPQEFLFWIAFYTKDDPHVEGHKGKLREQYTNVPAMGAHLMEIDATVGRKQRREHHQGEDGIDHLAQSITRSIELGNEVERKIYNRAHSDSYGQRPVL